MKKILLVLIAMCFMSGCLSTGTSSFPIQIKSHDEILASTGFVAKMAAIYIKAKYASEVDLYLNLAEQVLNSDTDAMLEKKVQIFFDELIAQIKDPATREAVKAYVNSFEIDINTSQIIFDPGARQTARDTIKIFRDVLRG